MGERSEPHRSGKTSIDAVPRETWDHRGILRELTLHVVTS